MGIMIRIHLVPLRKTFNLKMRLAFLIVLLLIVNIHSGQTYACNIFNEDVTKRSPISTKLEDTHLPSINGPIASAIKEFLNRYSNGVAFPTVQSLSDLQTGDKVFFLNDANPDQKPFITLAILHKIIEDPETASDEYLSVQLRFRLIPHRYIFYAPTEDRFFSFVDTQYTKNILKIVPSTQGEVTLLSGAPAFLKVPEYRGWTTPDSSSPYFYRYFLVSKLEERGPFVKIKTLEGRETYAFKDQLVPLKNNILFMYHPSEDHVSLKKTLDELGVSRNYLYDLEKGNQQLLVVGDPDLLNSMINYFTIAHSLLSARINPEAHYLIRTYFPFLARERWLVQNKLPQEINHCVNDPFMLMSIVAAEAANATMGIEMKKIMEHLKTHNMPVYNFVITNGSALLSDGLLMLISNYLLHEPLSHKEKKDRNSNQTAAQESAPQQDSSIFWGISPSDSKNFRLLLDLSKTAQISLFEALEYMLTNDYAPSSHTKLHSK